MRIIFVNHCHPEMAHICSVRARELAKAMVRQGHQVVLLTESLDRRATELSIDKLGPALRRHKWDEVFILPVQPVSVPRLEALRDERTSSLRRRIIVVWQYVVHSGVFTDWRTAVRPCINELVGEFQPDVLWAPFGNTDCWNIAQDIADRAHCPWVGDHKDYWRTFIPAPLRRLLANRYRSQRHWTALSDTNADEARKWFSGTITTVYSGVPDSWISPAASSPATPGQLSLTGGLHNEKAMTLLIEALSKFAKAQTRQDGAPALRLVYAGHDIKRFQEATKSLPSSVHCEANGYLPLEKLRELYQSSAANIYLNNIKTFHHKIFELLAAGRPILCLPAEQPEALELAKTTGVSIYSCNTDQELQSALYGVVEDQAPLRHAATEDFPFTWSRQAEALARVLEQAGELPRA